MDVRVGQEDTRERYDRAMRRMWSLAAIAAIASFPAAGAAQPAGFEAGAAAVEITPVLCPDAAPDATPEPYDTTRGCFRWVHLAGFSPFVPFRGDIRLATGIHDPLWARALALRDAEGDTLVLVALDLPGIGRQHTGPIRRLVQRELSIPVEQVVIHSTHTHSAPDASGYWSTLRSDHNDHYVAWLRERVTEAIRGAVAALRPATLTTATTTHVACADRRTGRLKHARDCRLPAASHQMNDSPDAWDRFVIQRDLRDPIVGNTNIVAAGFDDADTGATIATFINWHNHPDTLGSANRLISSDYPHYLRAYVERERGGVAIFVAGTVGNQISGLRGTPVPLWDEAGRRVTEPAPGGGRQPVLVTEDWAKIRSTGYEIGHAAVTALAGAQRLPSPGVAVSSSTFYTPVDNVIHLLGTWPVWHHGVEPEDRPRYAWPDCWGLLGCVRAEVSLIEVGDLAMLTAPGEIDPAYALGRPASAADYGEWGIWEFPAMDGVVHLMPGRHHAFIGSAHDYLSYLMPPSDNTGWWNFDHPNHYEEWVTIGARFGEGVRRAWRDLLEARMRSVP
ncbi:MAG: hypothetical protein F4Y45_09995 [Acidobacteria bacterium]|nr:hypothetical protein [Acidobacteriota bacterium]MYJ04416.1 hypothetical protein [Acidobacteriota bacterium]